MKILIMDTETTGVEPGIDQIIEAAWLEMPPTVDEFMAVKQPSKFPSYNQRFRPTKSISYGAMAVHGIIGADLEDCIPSTDAQLPHSLGFVIGHNVDFDMRMFGDDTEPRRICTLALSRWLFPELDSHRQEAMIYFIGHEVENVEWARGMLKNSHAALDDVMACAVLLRFLIGKIRNRAFTCDTWEELAALSDDARIPTKMPFGKHKGDAIADVPTSYVRWYMGTPDQDPYLIQAFRKAGKV